MSYLAKYPIGDIRPNQLLLTYGVGAIVDLPHLSTLVMGLDDWDTRTSAEIFEPRLLMAVQSIMGPQLKQLLSPPASDDKPGVSTSMPTGIPVATFPRWMVCPVCHMMAPVDSNVFQLKAYRYHPDKTCYRHEICSKSRFAPIVVPSRFMIACSAGHLDDFPWMHYVHGSRPCNHASLYMYEYGVSGEPSDIYIKCETCGTSRPMSDAFNSEEDEHTYRPLCTGRTPHLRSYAKHKCTQDARTILLSASNTWFPLVYSTLSIPEGEDLLSQKITNHWDILQAVNTIEGLKVFMAIPAIQRSLADYSEEEIWNGIQRKKGNMPTTVTPGDLKLPEWQVLSDPLHAPRTDDFEIVPTNIPEGYEDYIQQVVLVERLREVRALTGFTRLESLGDYAEDEELPRDHIMHLTRKSPEWIPAAEVRGEGIFIQFREDTLQHWLEQRDVQSHNSIFRDAHRRWRDARNIDHPEANYPDIRYILLHTFAHALMRQLTLECGYAAASIRERIYAQPPTAAGGAMAGILIYTAASDSEGTLGGLVSLGKQLGYHIDGALDDMQYCASDPLCAEHVSLEDNTLHGSACHACMFIPETSCERGNKYLDRSVLIRTVERDNLAFFNKFDA
ncbi:DUF1998 domain-containing protein [Ktedonobacteria bacterium brp13]|nr:DUF1998 domain-containing protein [Ktedonobacteria bacterium brp13]